jgi:hypothetical protein
MRSMPAIVAIVDPVESSQPCVDAVTRTLMELIDRRSTSGKIEPGSGRDSEEVLVDTEVDGSRYLLLRIPKPNRTRSSVRANRKLFAWSRRAIPTRSLPTF